MSYNTASEESKGDEDRNSQQADFDNLKSALELPIGLPEANLHEIFRKTVDNKPTLNMSADEKVHPEPFSSDLDKMEMGFNESKSTSEQVSPNVNKSGISRDAMNKLVAETLGGKKTRKANKRRKISKTKKAHKSRKVRKSKKARKTRK